MKMVVTYLNFVFLNKVKAKSKYRILNSVFQFIKKTKWHFGYTDFLQPRFFNLDLIVTKLLENQYYHK